jgi:hypothetical protein
LRASLAAIADDATVSTCSTSIMSRPVRYRPPTTTWLRRHRRKIIVIEPS